MKSELGFDDRVNATVAHNCHIKTKCSQQIKNRSHQIANRSQQIANRSQQIQIAHSKFKSPTANSNRSQQIQIAHIKLQIINSARRLRLAIASGATRLKIFVIHVYLSLIHI